MANLWYVWGGIIVAIIPWYLSQKTNISNHTPKVIFSMTIVAIAYLILFLLGMILLFSKIHYYVFGKIFYLMAITLLYYLTSSLWFVFQHSKKINSVHLFKHGLSLVMASLNLLMHWTIMSVIFANLNYALRAGDMLAIIGFGIITPLGLVLVLTLISILKSSLIITTYWRKKLVLENKKLQFLVHFHGFSIRQFIKHLWMNRKTHSNFKKPTFFIKFTKKKSFF